jgi:hypothetical protein
MDLEKNPYSALLAKLSGVKPPPIRARQGWQQFMHERYTEDIAPTVEEEWKTKQAAGVSSKEKNDAGFRAAVARKVYSDLPIEEQKRYEKSAKDDKEAAVAAYKKALEEGFSKTPEKHQL